MSKEQRGRGAEGTHLKETKPHLHLPVLQVHKTQREGRVHFTFKPKVLTFHSLPCVSFLNKVGRGSSSPFSSALITTGRLLGVGGLGSNHPDYLLCLASSSAPHLFIISSENILFHLSLHFSLLHKCLSLLSLSLSLYLLLACSPGYCCFIEHWGER